jgi:hypothetical protein
MVTTAFVAAVSDHRHLGARERRYNEQTSLRFLLINSGDFGILE